MALRSSTLIILDIGCISSKRIPMVDGLEYDALTEWSRYLSWKPGIRKYAKRKYNRRERRLARKACRDFLINL